LVVKYDKLGQNRTVIQSVTIERFKRFEAATFTFEGQHVVLDGLNDSGKTTVLQAISAWSLALSRWRELNRFSQVKGYYTKAPIARQAFSAAPIQRFDLLWFNRKYKGKVIVEIQFGGGWSIAMEFLADTMEQIYVRPKRGTNPLALFNADLETVFVAAMSGLGRQEPLYSVPATVADILGQAKSGDVLKNILVQAFRDENAWDALTRSMDKLFGYRLLPPEPGFAYIEAEYQIGSDGPIFDLSGAGSGSLQVMLLLAILNLWPNSVILIDEPEAHLHPELQKTVCQELVAVAEQQHLQLIMATRSQIIIDAVMEHRFQTIRIPN
jgi:AAA domain, putative AbiEii toxin, Type IV TA system